MAISVKTRRLLKIANMKIIRKVTGNTFLMEIEVRTSNECATWKILTIESSRKKEWNHHINRIWESTVL